MFEFCFRGLLVDRILNLKSFKFNTIVESCDGVSLLAGDQSHVQFAIVNRCLTVVNSEHAPICLHLQMGRAGPPY